MASLSTTADNACASVEIRACKLSSNVAMEFSAKDLAYVHTLGQRNDNTEAMAAMYPCKYLWFNITLSDPTRGCHQTQDQTRPVQTWHGPMPPPPKHAPVTEL